MPISAMPTNKRSERSPPRCHCARWHQINSDDERVEAGFTLIEIMVVLFLIGLFSAAVIVNLPDPRGSLIKEAEKFAARTAAARDEAIISARATRVVVDQRGYRFERRRRGQWTNFEGKPLLPARWQESTTASRALLAFDSTGLVEEPTRLRISRGSEQVSVFLDQDGSVRVVG